MYAIQLERHLVSEEGDRTGVEFKKGKGSDGSLAECQVLVNEGQTGEKDRALGS